MATSLYPLSLSQGLTDDEIRARLHPGLTTMEWDPATRTHVPRTSPADPLIGNAQYGDGRGTADPHRVSSLLREQHQPWSHRYFWTRLALLVLLPVTLALIAGTIYWRNSGIVVLLWALGGSLIAGTVWAVRKRTDIWWENSILLSKNAVHDEASVMQWVRYLVAIRSFLTANPLNVQRINFWTGKGDSPIKVWLEDKLDFWIFQLHKVHGDQGLKSWALGSQVADLVKSIEGRLYPKLYRRVDFWLDQWGVLGWIILSGTPLWAIWIFW